MPEMAAAAGLRQEALSTPGALRKPKGQANSRLLGGMSASYKERTAPLGSKKSSCRACCVPRNSDLNRFPIRNAAKRERRSLNRRRPNLRPLERDMAEVRRF